MSKALIVVHPGSLDVMQWEETELARIEDPTAEPEKAAEFAGRLVSAIQGWPGPVYIIDEGWLPATPEFRQPHQTAQSAFQDAISQTKAQWIRFDEAQGDWARFLPALLKRLEADGADSAVVTGLWWEPEAKSGCAHEVYTYLSKHMPVSCSEAFLARPGKPLTGSRHASEVKAGETPPCQGGESGFEPRRGRHFGWRDRRAAGLLPEWEAERDRAIEKDDQRWFQKQVWLFEDQFSEGDPGYGTAKDFHWSYDPSFDINQLSGEFVEWFAEEQKMWQAEDAVNRYGEDFGEALVEPITVVEGADGQWHLWDGNHRVGYAMTAGIGTLPAFVGKRKARSQMRRRRADGGEFESDVLAQKLARGAIQFFEEWREMAQKADPKHPVHRLVGQPISLKDAAVARTRHEPWPDRATINRSWTLAIRELVRQGLIEVLDDGSVAYRPPMFQMEEKARPFVAPKTPSEIKTVDPGAEFDRLIWMRDKGQITQDQFEDKVRRLFGLRATWMLRRGGKWGYENIVFIQDSDDPFFRILDDEGEDAAMEYLMNWYDPHGNYDVMDERPWGSDDALYEKDNFIMSYDTGLGYAGLARRVPPGYASKPEFVEQVKTVDPGAEFDRLIWMRDKGQITQDQFEDKVRRLFGLRATWMLRRGGKWGYENIVFIQDSDDPFFRILDDEGEDAAMEYLMNWYDPHGNYDVMDERPWGSDDALYEKDNFIMSYDTGLGYAGLARRVPPGYASKPEFVEQVKTVDPEAEFDRLIEMKERGEITPEDFSEKSRRLFGLRRLWSLRRANVGLPPAEKVYLSFVRDIGLGLDQERALEHAFSNWLTFETMHRQIKGIEPMSEEEKSQVLSDAQKIIAERGLPKTALRRRWSQRRAEPEAKTLAVDFDGTIATYEKGQFPRFGEPIDGAREALQKFRDAGWTILIYSSRALMDGQIEKMRAWLDEHGIVYDEIRPKAMASFYIDDLAIHFDGDWRDVVDQVESGRRADGVIAHGMPLKTASYLFDPKRNPVPFPRPGQQSGLWGSVMAFREGHDDRDELWFLVENDWELYQAAQREVPARVWKEIDEAAKPASAYPEVNAFLKKYFHRLNRYVYDTYGEFKPGPEGEGDPSWAPLAKEIVQKLRAIYGDEGGRAQLEAFLARLDPDEREDFVEAAERDPWDEMVGWLGKAVEKATGETRTPSKKTKMRVEDVPALSTEDIGLKRDELLDAYSRGDITQEELERRMRQIERMARVARRDDIVSSYERGEITHTDLVKELVRL